MANTQTTVPTFVDGEVLGGERLNQSAGTGVPVFATTVTRDAGFGGAGEKTLAEGQLCYLESTNVVQYYDGAAWATLGPAPAAASGLTFISSTNASGTSFTISNCFSATYDNYILQLSNITKGAIPGKFRLRLGSGTAHAFNLQYIAHLGTTLTVDSSASSGNFINLDAGYTTDGGYININSPFLSAPTTVGGSTQTNSEFAIVFGIETSSSSFTDITFSNTNAVSFTGGTVKVFGYANS